MRAEDLALMQTLGDGMRDAMNAVHAEDYDSVFTDILGGAGDQWFYFKYCIAGLVSFSKISSPEFVLSRLCITSRSRFPPPH